MSQPEDHYRAPEDQVRDQAKMVLIETLVSALIPVAAKGSEAVIKQILSPDPVFVQVLDSIQVEDRHEIVFKLTNNTLHGVYLESASLLEPQGDYAVILSKGPGPIGWPPSDLSHHPSKWLPTLIKPADKIHFTLIFPFCKNRGLDSDWCGTLELLVSRLEEAKPHPQKVRFRIRWN